MAAEMLFLLLLLLALVLVIVLALVLVVAADSCCCIEVRFSKTDVLASSKTDVRIKTRVLLKNDSKSEHVFYASSLPRRLHPAPRCNDAALAQNFVSIACYTKSSKTECKYIEFN